MSFPSAPLNPPIVGLSTSFEVTAIASYKYLLFSAPNDNLSQGHQVEGRLVFVAPLLRYHLRHLPVIAHKLNIHNLSFNPCFEACHEQLAYNEEGVIGRPQMNVRSRYWNNYILTKNKAVLKLSIIEGFKYGYFSITGALLDAWYAVCIRYP